MKKIAFGTKYVQKKVNKKLFNLKIYFKTWQK